MDELFARWEREDALARTYTLSPVLAAAAAMRLGAPGWVDFDHGYGGGRIARTRAPLPTGPTAKRAKVKAARRANRARMGKKS